LAEAEAAAAQASARVQAAETQSLSIAREQLEQTRVAAAQADRELERAEYLFGLGGIPRAQLEAAQRERDLASSRVTEASARLESARDSEAALARAQLEQAQAAVEAARSVLAETVVRAPADGVVVDRLVDPGAAVQAGETLIELITTGATQLVVEPDEANLALLEVGQPAIASAEAFPERTFRARVAWIAPTVDPDRG